MLFGDFRHQRITQTRSRQRIFHFSADCFPTARTNFPLNLVINPSNLLWKKLINGSLIGRNPLQMTGTSLAFFDGNFRYSMLVGFGSLETLPPNPAMSNLSAAFFSLVFRQ